MIELPPATAVGYLESVTDYLDRFLQTVEHCAVTRTSWRIEDIEDLILDIRNEVQVLLAAAEVFSAANG